MAQEALEQRVGELSVYCMVESARCYQQLADFQQCVVMCTNVLAIYPQHLEALIFRAPNTPPSIPLRADPARVVHHGDHDRGFPWVVSSF
jgi:hypothetical protein